MPGFERKAEMPKKEAYDVSEKIDPMELLMLKKENFELNERIKELERRIAEQEKRSAEREKLITKDELTGLGNRRGFDEQMGKIMARRWPGEEHRGSKGGNYLITFDVDKFKEINDSNTHLKGDEVLEEIGAVIGKTTRDKDYFARTGGDEFAGLFEDISEERALEIANQLKDGVKNNLNIVGKGGKKLDVSISVGVAKLEAEDTEDSFKTRADLALYNSKNNGRDAVSIGRLVGDREVIEEYRPLTEEKTFLDGG